MQYVIALLRLVHIVAAFFWFGIGTVSFLFIGPAATKAGASGSRFLKVILTQTPINIAIAASGSLTTLMGILLYLTNPSQRFSPIGSAVLGIGALAGIAAMLHGFLVLQKVTLNFLNALKSDIPDGDTPVPAETLAKVQSLGNDYNSRLRLSIILLVLALVFMASARYL